MSLSNDAPTIIGVIASVFTGTSLVPQPVTIVRKKKAENVSMGMLLILFGGQSLGWCMVY